MSRATIQTNTDANTTLQFCDNSLNSRKSCNDKGYFSEKHNKNRSVIIQYVNVILNIYTLNKKHLNIIN